MKLKTTVFAKFIAGLAFLTSVLTWVGVVLLISKHRTVIEGLPSAILLGILFLLPTVELLMVKPLKSWGMSFRALLLLTVDVVFLSSQTFASIYWEVVGVAMSLMFVVYWPNVEQNLRWLEKPRDPASQTYLGMRPQTFMRAAVVSLVCTVVFVLSPIKALTLIPGIGGILVILVLEKKNL